jgi:hypothetical protein
VRLTLPDGTVILAQGRLDLVPSQRPREPDFAIYLDERWRNDPQVTWPFRIIGWEDFGLPVDEPEIFTAIVDLYRRARSGELVEVACHGGVGPTRSALRSPYSAPQASCASAAISCWLEQAHPDLLREMMPPHPAVVVA